MAIPAPNEPDPAQPRGEAPGEWQAGAGVPLNGHGAAGLNGHAAPGADSNAPEDGRESATSTVGAVNHRPRGGNGQFRRDLAHAERDGRAALLACQGWTYPAIAAELGYHDKGAAWRAVQNVLVETARGQGGTEELRVKKLNELAELRRVAWEVVLHPPPALDRMGNPTDVPDVQAQIQAMLVIVKAGEREARLRGLDAARKSLHATVDLPTADLEAVLAELRAQQAAEASPLMITGTVEPGESGTPGPEAPHPGSGPAPG